MPEEKLIRNGDKSFTKQFEIIQLISDTPRGLQGKEVVQKTGMATSTVFRILKFLTEKNMLLNRDGRYILGPAFLRWGSCAERQNPLRQLAHPLLEELAEQTTETVHIAILKGTQVCYIDKVEGTRSIRMSSLTGSVAPAYCTGIGKVLLAYQESRQLEDILDHLTFTRFTPNTITEKQLLLEELEHVRKCGHAVDNSEHEAGVFCIAAPIFQADKKIIAGISVSGAEVYLKDKTREISRAVKETAERISRTL